MTTIVFCRSWQDEFPHLKRASKVIIEVLNFGPGGQALFIKMVLDVAKLQIFSFIMNFYYLIYKLSSVLSFENASR